MATPDLVVEKQMVQQPDRQEPVDIAPDGVAPEPASQRLVLNVGCGVRTEANLHPLFRSVLWRELRLDIDPRVQPDVVGSMTDMAGIVGVDTVDAVWSSHNLEHLYDHEVVPALREFNKVLRPNGFSLITCPNLQQVADIIRDRDLEATVYVSSAGPISALDMIYGHRRSIAEGNGFMAHKTGFTETRLGQALIEAGFAEAWVTHGASFDLWAAALMPETNRVELWRWLEEQRFFPGASR